MDRFGRILIKWYDKNKRNLPWRSTRDPYKIWLSEVILQQTRVEQGLNYYLKFVERFPTIKKLAAADSDEIYKMWQGLGYYNRADNMMNAAKAIVKDFNGRFPADYDELLNLKGVGNYTAAAIASLAFNISKPVVDGNVFRVLSRLFAIKTPINTSAGKKEFELIASKLISDHPPAEFNQALMEFGALYCKPKNPDCENCIFKKDCIAWQKKEVISYPVKLPKRDIKKRFFYYVAIESDNGEGSFFLMKKRDKNDIWKKLYDFPLVEFSNITEPHTALNKLLAEINLKSSEYRIVDISDNYKHQLTHQQINAVFIRIFVNKIENIEAENSILLVNKNDITNYPVSRLIERYLQDQKLI